MVILYILYFNITLRQHQRFKFKLKFYDICHFKSSTPERYYVLTFADLVDVRRKLVVLGPFAFRDKCSPRRHSHSF